MSWSLVRDCQAFTLNGLEARARYWADRGAPVRFVDRREDVARLIGSDLYPAALHDERAFSINPLAYATGLSVGAAALGVRQFTETPAVRLERGATGWRVTTPRGEIEADQVLLCTDSYTGPALWPGLAANGVRIRGHQAVTAPLRPDQLGRVLPGAAIVTDTRHTWSGLRKLPDGSLHLSSGGPSLSGQSRADLRSVRRRLAELYPWLGEVQWADDWAGWVLLSPDQYPTIRELGPGLLAAFGYSGRGLAASTLVGRQLAQLAQGQPATEAFVRVGASRPLPCPPVARLTAASAVNWYRFVDSRTRRA